MSIIKSPSQALIEERQKNAVLRAELQKEKNMLQFLGLLAAGVDINELTVSTEVYEDVEQ